MRYPTLAEVESSDKEQLARWYRFLPSPGYNLLTNMPDEESDIALAAQSAIVDRIFERFNAMGGFTPELSKKIGWDK
jgi:hypothetical protein